MARGNAYRFRRFARGLNTADGPYGLREGYADDPTGLGSEARDCLNVISRDRGNVRQRNGSNTFANTADAKDLNVVDSDASGLAIFSTTGGALKAVDEGGTVTSLVASGLSATAPWKFLYLPTIGGQGPYLGMNGVDAPRYVTATPSAGSWTATVGSVPNGQFMVYAGNRLFVSGSSSNPYAVYFSNIGDPRDWPVANVIEFEPKDGQPITGLGTVGPYVLVFKQHAVYAIYNTETGANRKITDQAGTSSPRSIVPSEKGTFFLDAERGVMVTDGQEAKRISTQIQPTLDRITQADKVNVTGAFWKNHYYLSCKFDGTDGRVLDYDTELDSWWVHSNNVTALATFDTGTATRLIGAGVSTLIDLYVEGTTLDQGVAFQSYWSGPFHDFGASDLLKRCREIAFDGRGKVDVYVVSDFYDGLGNFEGQGDFNRDNTTFGGTGTFGGDGIFGGGVTIGNDSLYSLGVGRVWSVSVGSSTGEYWELDSYTMRMDQRKD